MPRDPTSPPTRTGPSTRLPAASSRPRAQPEPARPHSAPNRRQRTTCAGRAGNDPSIRIQQRIINHQEGASPAPAGTARSSRRPGRPSRGTAGAYNWKKTRLITISTRWKHDLSEYDSLVLVGMSMVRSTGTGWFCCVLGRQTPLSNGRLFTSRPCSSSVVFRRFCAHWSPGSHRSDRPNRSPPPPCCPAPQVRAAWNAGAVLTAVRTITAGAGTRCRPPRLYR